ncbi:beta-L-arabinofuranosidase domain-containing protein [Paenibacillus sp. CF384]|uniref:beta-L-arabinofuranosidase domain-containing protein n=1 Tax=Paenibacillus sp. CF384 TaxID=1884382 RepID=UPI00089860C8|nr:beta-L-arabinofuranosidase domain-containing protein [Paenibacillus sp. CF384]SDX57833.1 Beta-L-arabinofuranosidase, GH127 [Paenibacillus sp. CF384]
MIRNTAQLEQIAVQGDLLDRLRANAARLADPLYSPEEVFKPSSYDWPGDNEGRTLLAQILTARATGEDAVHLDAILAKVPFYLNGLGYFGNILPEGITDEQQLSGNSWFLRALCELYAWKRQPEVLEQIGRIVKNLLLPAHSHFAHYPTDPSERAEGGEASGTLADKTVRDWYLSTDIGCAFIMLDGATHAYELLQWPELEATVQEMIERFLAIDLAGINAQTHATLSALRGILRYYGMSGDKKLLHAAESIYSLYLNEGKTENYANRNWFNRPWWTEPCAVVDSFVAAVELWRYTDHPHYLETAHLIYYNAISHGQRENGGFGCDCCTREEEPSLYALENVYEAYWCCTMRGGEGLSRAAEYSYWLREDELTVPFYHANKAELSFAEGTVSVELETRYPYEGYASLTVVQCPYSIPQKTIRLFVPSYSVAGSAALRLNGALVNDAVLSNGFIEVPAVILATGVKLELSFDIELQQVPIQSSKESEGPAMVTLRHGALLLHGPHDVDAASIQAGSTLTPLGNAVYRDEKNKHEFLPIYRPIREAAKQDALAKKPILFR